MLRNGLKIDKHSKLKNIIFTFGVGTDITRKELCT